MAANTQRNSTNLSNSPTITIVDSIESRNKKATMGSCCFCVPEIVGVFAILSMYFFTGIFGAAASFLSLGYTGDVLTKAILGISGTLNTLTAISSALGVTAIRKEKFVLMRRLSIAFWVLTALVIILNIIILVFDFKSREANVEECVNYNNGFGVSPNDDVLRAECEHAVGASLIGETIRLVALGTISIYFAYVIFRFAKNMKKEVLPFTATTVPINGQSTPTYYVSAQPPTSNNWVPPPTYTVKALYVPDDFKPDSKNP